MKITWGLMLLAALAAGSAGAATDRFHVGCPIHIDKASDADVLAAGCEVALEARVDGKAMAAGGRVEIGPQAVVESAALAGGRIEMRGTVKGNLRAAGGHVLIDGPVEGDASVAAGSLALGPNARIDGRLRYRGDGLEQDPKAQVGSLEHSRGSHHHRAFGPFHGRSHAPGWIWTAGLMLLAGIFAALLPGASGRVTQAVRERPGATILFGFIAFVCIPVAAVLFMVTVIGIPLGVLAILGYAALLLVGYVATSVITGGLLLDRFGAAHATRMAWRVAAAVLAMLAIALVGRIPVLGHFVAFAALIVGVGAIVAAILNRRAEAPPAPA